MKKLMVIAIILVLAGCGQESKTQAAPISEANPVKRGVITMDAIYASETAFMQKGMPAIETIVRELQTALAMWPQDGTGEGIDACRMAIRQQTTRMLNLMDHVSAPKGAKESDFRQACRDAVGYEYDDARMRQVWIRLTAQ